MISYVLSESAEEDPLSIFVDTLEKWGPDQAELYQDRVASSFDRIVTAPFLSGSKAYDDHPGGCRFLKIGKHIVFYLSDVSPIGIARILHESMEIPNQLNELDFP